MSQSPDLQPPYPPQQAPQPQGPQRKTNPLVIVLAIAGGVLLAICLLCGGILALSGALGSRGATTSNGTPGSQSSPSGPAKVGDTITVDKVGCTLVSAAIFHSNNQFIQPKAGNAFVRVSVKIHNGSSSEVSYNEFDFHAKSSAGNITDSAFVSGSHDLNSGKLAAGGTVTGDITFEIPIGDHGAQLTWQPSFFGSSDEHAWLLGV